LEKTIITSRTGNQSASIATSMGIWPKNTERRKRRKLKNVLNATKKNTLLNIAKKSNQ